MPPNSRLTLVAIIVFSLFTIVIVGLVVFLYLNRSPISASINLDKEPQITNPKAIDIKNGLFESQNASFMGQILKIDGNNLDVVNEKGVTGKVSLSENVTIFDLANNNPDPTHDLKNIRINTKTLISLEAVDGEYMVTTITYPQPIGAEIANPIHTATSSSQ